MHLLQAPVFNYVVGGDKVSCLPIVNLHQYYVLYLVYVELTLLAILVIPSTLASTVLGATFAFQQDKEPLLIKAQGDWKSDCVQSYVDTTLEQQWTLVQQLAIL